MKAQLFNFSVGPGEFFIGDGGLDELVDFYKAVQKNPTAKLYECSTLPNYEDESSWEADGDCYVILADNLQDAKEVAKEGLGKDTKHKVTLLKG